MIRQAAQIRKELDELQRCVVEARRKNKEIDQKMSELGSKHDKGKPRWSLLPCGSIVQVIKVLEFGADRYGVDNWMHVEDARRRYYDAAMRHIEAWLCREDNDPDSGLPHLAHAVCCLLFLMWFDAKEKSSVGK